MEYSSKALVATAKASGYLQQLCEHFGHKTEVEFSPEAGRIVFDFGVAELTVGADGLTMTANARNEDDLARLCRVLASHLERFAFREDLDIHWED